VKAAFAAHYLEYGATIEEELFGGFVAMLTHDALIGVMDRHHENWGVIVRREIGGPKPASRPSMTVPGACFVTIETLS
jgi:hypothetical protein